MSKASAHAKLIVVMTETANQIQHDVGTRYGFTEEDDVPQQVHPRIQKLLDQPSFPQRSPEWFEQRKKYLTASSCAAALDIKPYASYRGSPRLELMQKLKVPDETPFSNRFTDHGNLYEPEACRLFEERYGQKVLEVGMMTNPSYPFLGASPDGLCAYADDEGRVSAIEIKCPLTRKIVPGAPPPDVYWPQILVCLPAYHFQVAWCCK